MCCTLSSLSSTRKEHGSFVTNEVSGQVWEQAWVWPTYCRDIDALFVTLDANFRLRRRVVLNYEIDPSLSQGWGYFVEDTAFKAYLHDHKGDTQEVHSYFQWIYLRILNLMQKSTCSNHNAVNMADMKMKKGCDATGVGMVVCARHGMRLPNGVADLQYGERCVVLPFWCK